MLSHAFGTPKANVPVTSARISGKAVAENAGELVGRYIKHMVTAASDAFAKCRRVLSTVFCIIGIGLEQAARPLSLVARKVEYTFGRCPF